jgi:hypothetical protein
MKEMKGLGVREWRVAGFSCLLSGTFAADGGVAVPSTPLLVWLGDLTDDAALEVRRPCHRLIVSSLCLQSFGV